MSRDFLDAVQPAVPGQLTELRMMRNGGVQSHFSHDRDGIEVVARAWSRDGWDVFYGVLPRLSARGRTEDCPSVTGVIWADIDNKNVGGDHLASLMRLGALHLMPSIIVDSGNGLHSYWLLRQPEPFYLVQPLMKGLQAAIGSDKVHDAPRVLRLPGTLNHKECPASGYAANAETGEWEKRPHGGDYCKGKPVRLLHFEPDRKYRLSDFDHFTPPEPRPAHYEPLSDSAWEPSSPTAPKFPEGTRNVELTRLAGIMAAKHMQPIDILAALLRENALRCNPPLESVEVERIARSASRWT